LLIVGNVTAQAQFICIPHQCTYRLFSNGSILANQFECSWYAFAGDLFGRPRRWVTILIDTQTISRGDGEEFSILWQRFHCPNSGSFFFDLREVMDAMLLSNSKELYLQFDTSITFYRMLCCEVVDV